VVDTDDGPKLVFCSNDYLGLAGDPRVTEAMTRAVQKWGAGAASSRLVSGNTAAHERLQSEMARFAGTQEAVVFPSGYQANVGAITALTGTGDVIFSDEMVHASLIDGIRLSRASTKIFRHRDVDQLKTLLAETPNAPVKLIVTDAVFSMDGDLAPLEGIVDAAETVGALVYVDEAHGVGVLGPAGRGLTAKLGLTDRVAVQILTFGKALGVSGACVAGSRHMAGLVRSGARSLLYTTAQPAALMEAVRVALGIVEAGDDLRAALRGNIALFKKLAGRAGLPLIDSATPVQPVLIGENARALEVSEKLWERGFFVQAIRPPTVPEGTARLRVTLTATHEPDHIERLVEELGTVINEETA
jgi:8-amino-7-oxononanoate synthase